MRELRPDWVYNNLSYTTVPEDLQAGQTNALGIQLVNSENVMRAVQFGQVEFLNLASANSATSEVVGSWERPEGRRTTVHAFEAYLQYVPSTWTLGTTHVIGARLVVFEQDAITGQAIVPAGYSMWTQNPALGSGLGRWANEKRCIHEWRWTNSFNSQVASPIFHQQLRWKFKWRLRPEEALFLYLEQQSGAASCRITTLCRTLLSGHK